MDKRGSPMDGLTRFTARVKLVASTPQCETARGCRVPRRSDWLESASASAGCPLRNVLMGGVSAGALTHLMSIRCVPPIPNSPKEQGKDPLCLSEC
jgi:hypothetical protein